MSVYFTPGPSQPHPRLRRFLEEAWDEDIAAISHRGAKFTDIYRIADNGLRKLMQIPDEYGVMFVGSATEAMERVTQGAVQERSHHFVNGAFGDKWREIAAQLGKHATVTRAEAGQGFAEAELTAPDRRELICLTHNETSAGTMLPESVLQSLTTLPRRPLIALDIVSSAPLVPVPWDNLDAGFFSVQKAFGLPAGLGVLVAGPRLLARAEELHAGGLSVGSFHSLPELAAGAAKFQTPATPNVLGIYLLGRVCADMLESDLSQTALNMRRRAEAMYGWLDEASRLHPLVTDIAWRSPTVIVIRVDGGSGALVQRLQEAGLVVARGYGQAKDEQVRIANFPAISDEAFELLTAQLRRFDQK